MLFCFVCGILNQIVDLLLPVVVGVFTAFVVLIYCNLELDWKMPNQIRSFLFAVTGCMNINKFKSRKSNGEIKMLQAVTAGDVDAFIQLLCKEHVDPSFNKQRLLCLLSSFISDDTDEILRILLNDRRVCVTIDDNLPIRQAALFGQLEKVKMLCEHGADIHSCNNFALRYAVKNGHDAVVKYLLTQGADPCVNNHETLMDAIQSGDFKIVSLLIEKIDFTEIDKNDSFIKSAIATLNPDIVSLLIERGVTLQYTDELLEKVKESKCIEMYQIFRDVL